MMLQSIYYTIQRMHNVDHQLIRENQAFKNMDKLPCRIVVVNLDVASALKNAYMNLVSDDFCANFFCGAGTAVIPKNHVKKQGFPGFIQLVENAMKNLQHALHRGKIYYKIEKGSKNLILVFSQIYLLNEIISAVDTKEISCLYLNGNQLANIHLYGIVIVINEK